MKPMALVAWGFLVVVVDIKINEFDLVVDFAGWMMCLTGLGRVTQHSRWFGYALYGCIPGALLSVPEFFGADIGPAGGIVLAVAMLTLVFGTCSGIIDCVRNARTVSTANTIRWWTLALDLVGILVILAVRTGSGTVGPELVLLVIPGLVLAIWFAVFLLRVQDEVEMVTAV